MSENNFHLINLGNKKYKLNKLKIKILSPKFLSTQIRINKVRKARTMLKMGSY